jgi:voltage-gated potassium channel
MEAGGHQRGRRWLERRVERKGLRPRFAAIIIAAVWTVAVVIFGVVEHLVDPKTFDNVWLGMWWAVQTVTTVGYGDVVPQATDGQVIAAFLMLGGLSFFAVVTGVITSGFVARAQADRRLPQEEDTRRAIEELSAKIDKLGADLARISEPG